MQIITRGCIFLRGCKFLSGGAHPPHPPLNPAMRAGWPCSVSQNVSKDSDNVFIIFIHASERLYICVTHAVEKFTFYSHSPNLHRRASLQTVSNPF